MTYHPFAYAAVFLGVFIEGEFLFLSSVVAAHSGHLDPGWVFLLGFLGTMASDQFYFHLGRSRGSRWFERTAERSENLARAVKKLEKNKQIILLTYRFLYGFRALIPAVLGMQGCRPLRFLAYSLAGTLLWCGIYFSLGYFIGSVIVARLRHIELIEFYVIAFLIVTGLVVYLVRKHILRRQEGLS